MLADVTDLLACPQCRSPVELDEGAILCDAGHTFDVARQGYVTLMTGAGGKFDGDSPEMIAARADFLGGGSFDPLMDAVADAVAAGTGAGDDPRLLEIGAGTGHYLARVLDATPTGRGIGLDVSKYAARRIARAHPRAGAVVADVWQHLPVRDHVLSHVLCVFAPRNADEAHRVLAEHGSLVVLTPTERHLGELVDLLGMVRVDDRKVERLGAAMSGRFERTGHVAVEYPMSLSHLDVTRLVGMGPSARHLTPERLASSIAALPQEYPVTASVTVSTYTRL
ncbi:Ribosomal RNA large subunit methyltransferase A [Rhodococcus wratislaviensis]|uniref:Ribosomal RNA large subunit methyltransferase A n=1 Tax=Rhodococcus wratislaviensis TaxID=44752 RepID=A0A402C888_RHOWR|nr:methyltransferase domain-containing protein [Rhodococcus wratislaviensis]GCE39835.1 Ribosomal RNA large subunit methyltransferase A [Rhodococcus wratislaviensis]